jgi:hypothetical protein
MRRSLALFVVLLTFVATDSQAKGRPSGGGHGDLTLTSAAVYPGPGDDTATASASVSVGRSAVTFAMSNVQISGFITTIAIYKGDFGSTGPMVVRLSPSPIGINQLMGTVPVDAALSRDMSRYPSSYFIQVNTNMFPGGALRAQLR